MRDPATEVLKFQALALRQYLNLAGLNISHGHSLELIAAVYGVSCWRALIASPARSALECAGARSALIQKLQALKYPLSAAVFLQVRTYTLLTTPPQGMALPTGFSANWPEGLPHLEELLDRLPATLFVYEEGSEGEIVGQRHARAFRNEQRLRKASTAFRDAMPGARAAQGRRWHDARVHLAEGNRVRLDHTYMWSWMGRTIVLTQPYDHSPQTLETHRAFDQEFSAVRTAGWHVETSLRSFYYPGWTVSALLISPA